MAYNPYQVAQSQTGLMEALLGAEQKKKSMQSAASGQMAKMEKDFNAQLRLAQKRAEEALSKKKKGGGLAKLGNIVSMFAGPIAGPILGGLTSAAEMKGQSDFAKRQAKRAKGAALGLDFDRYGKTFLGKKALDYKADTESAFDDMIQKADVGMGDLLKTGLQSGISSMAMSEIGGSIMGGMKDVGAAKGIEKTLGEGGLEIGDVVGEGGVVNKEAMNLLTESQKLDFSKFAEKGGIDSITELADEGYLKNIFQQMQKPAQIGLEEGQSNFLQQLLMMLGR